VGNRSNLGGGSDDTVQTAEHVREARALGGYRTGLKVVAQSLTSHKSKQFDLAISDCSMHATSSACGIHWLYISKWKWGPKYNLAKR
jgi:hypothetical protein